MLTINLYLWIMCYGAKNSHYDHLSDEDSFVKRKGEKIPLKEYQEILDKVTMGVERL